jgi:hypothetical protein
MLKQQQQDYLHFYRHRSSSTHNEEPKLSLKSKSPAGRNLVEPKSEAAWQAHIERVKKAREAARSSLAGHDSNLPQQSV